MAFDCTLLNSCIKSHSKTYHIYSSTPCLRHRAYNVLLLGDFYIVLEIKWLLKPESGFYLSLFEVSVPARWLSSLEYCPIHTHTQKKKDCKLWVQFPVRAHAVSIPVGACTRKGGNQSLFLCHIYVSLSLSLWLSLPAPFLPHPLLCFLLLALRSVTISSGEY